MLARPSAGSSKPASAEFHKLSLAWPIFEPAIVSAGLGSRPHIRQTNMMRRSRFLSALMLLALAGIAGCGKGLYEVKGTVVYKDESDVSVLAGGQVVFDPVDQEVVKSRPRGVIQPDGSFVMFTYEKGDGVHAGKYRVRVAPPPWFRKSEDEERPILFDEKYKTSATSGLEITVTGPQDDYQITLQKP
jgi:hypothetical protein